jgi:hypothetical protein
VTSPSPLSAQDNTKTEWTHTHRHPCHELDSNPRSQRPSKQRVFMPYTSQSLWSSL